MFWLQLYQVKIIQTYNNNWKQVLKVQSTEGINTKTKKNI